MVARPGDTSWLLSEAATRRPKEAANGLEVSPWSTTESTIVQVAAVTRMRRFVDWGSLSTATIKNTTDASPRGPNHPMNDIVSGRVFVPINEIATGSILMTVKLRQA